MKSQYEIQIPWHSEQQLDSISIDEKHRRAMFIIGNKLNSEGRTYTHIDDDGEYVSSFVSQYSSIISNNIEPGVRSAVLGLHTKGYLTYTSCQGHADSKHRYIGVVFNTLDQKLRFMLEVEDMGLDIYWFDNAINTVERPCKPSPWWADPKTLHIVYDDSSFENSTIDDRRRKPYTDSDLTRYWNIQMCRSYDHYESIVFSFGYPIVESSIVQKVKKHLTFSWDKVNRATDEFVDNIHKLSYYEC